MGAKRGLKNLLIECFTRIYLRLILFIANLMTISSHFRAYKIKTYLLKLTLMKLDSNVFFDNGFDCVQPRNISIGKYCSFGHNNKFVAFNRIIIGPYVQSAIGLTLVAGSHRIDNYAPLSENQQIVLEGENWIGANVTIIGGVTIGRGSIIAAGAVVTEDIPAYSVAGGVPARVIKKRVPAPLVESPFGDYKPTLSS